MARELDELAERCEAATGRDDVLALEIARATNTVINAAPIGPDGRGIEHFPDYTASLDAAMTLTEPFMLIALSDIAADGLTGCCLCSDTSTNPPAEHWGIPSERGGDRQGILARAVCAAALRARAKQQTTGGKQ